MRERLTVVVPTLDSGGTLTATMEGLRNLCDIAATIVVDSGSTDDTLNIARYYKATIRFAPPGNMYTAINIGLREAETEWATYINSDDILYADAVRYRLKTLAERVEVSYGRVDFIDYHGRFLRSWRPAAVRSLPKLFRGGFSPLLQQGTLWRTRVSKALGGFDERFRYVADADFWCRAVATGATFSRHDGFTVAAFRMHPTQLSRTHSHAMQSEHHRAFPGCGKVMSRLSAYPSLARWRLENASSYAERLLRNSTLGGKAPICGSYDLPSEDGSSVFNVRQFKRLSGDDP